MLLRLATNAVRMIFQRMEIREDNGKMGDSYKIIIRTNLCDRTIKQTNKQVYWNKVFLAPMSNNSTKIKDLCINAIEMILKVFHFSLVITIHLIVVEEKCKFWDFEKCYIFLVCMIKYGADNSNLHTREQWHS